MATAPSSLNRPLSPETSSVLAKPYNVKTKEKPVISLEPKLDHEYLTGLKLFIVVAAAAIVAFLMLLDNMIAIPRITDEFHSLADVGWYASAYQFGSSAPQPLTGRIYKYFNTKWTFLVFSFIFEIGSVICGAATSSNMFIVGRFIAGFGAAGIATGSITIVSLCAPLEKRPPLLGYSLGFKLLGLVLGPVIGGAFTSYTTWRWCFYVNVPVGALGVLAIAFLRIPEETLKPKAWSLLPRIHYHLDLIGFVLFAPAILQLLLALQFGGQAYPWKSPQVIGLFCGATANAIVWGFWNRYRGEDAMIPSSLIRRWNVLFSGIYVAFLTSAVYGGIYYLPLYFQAVNGASAIKSAVYLLPMIIAQLITAGVSGVAVSKIGYVIPVAVFSTVFLSIGTGLYSLLQPGTSSGEWISFQILGGIGFGSGLQLAIIAVQAAMDSEELPSSIAFVVFSQALGPTIVMALYNIIFLESFQSQIKNYAPSVSPTAVINAGATGFRSFTSPADLPGVLKAYANSIDRIFYFAAALAAVCGIFLWGMGWHDLRKPKGKVPSTEENCTIATSKATDAQLPNEEGEKIS
ncbi:MFS general substrate transporter [Glarea lozoyensis ATCC 20868]|uniref:MFS general substrate transporter n=1 Tax=Glarea lozoyensis (strain ATCC 20868 / MF5171) TaxID=1116229 RepID=S3DP01_GLAL2|nr:MFS general substrate transporter [Glarea lozoyensis ATCC 20868]EPE28198.1 MFS general substrate transporter [Glarea lozoyensis ATCC 20868]